MRYILLVLLLAFVGLSCQSITSKKQARKGWKRVDQEWFSQQAAAKDQKMKPHRTPSQVERGQFICEYISGEKYGIRRFNEFDRVIIEWLNEKCDSDKVISSIYSEFSSGFGPKAMMCCVAK